MVLVPTSSGGRRNFGGFCRSEGESNRDGAGPDLLLVLPNVPSFMQFTRVRSLVL